MRLNLNDIPEDYRRIASPQVGDVYSKAGGSPGFWVVVSVKPNGDCYVLAYDSVGELTGASRYAASYFYNNNDQLVGRTQLPDMMNVEWLTPFRTR